MYDLEAWHVLPDGDLCGAALTGVPVSGMRKLVQRFLIAFLQDPDSVKYPVKRIPYGTYFMRQLQDGMMRTEMDVVGSFMLAKSMIRGALQAEETAYDDPATRYKDSELTGIILEPGWLKLKITVKSLIDEMAFTLPLSV